MDSIARLVSQRPVAIVLAFVAAWLVAGAFATGARYDFSFRTMAPHDAPDFAVFEEFETLFGASGDVYAIVFHAEPLITPATLRLVGRLTEKLERVSGTGSILSLTNVNDIRGEGDELIVAPFVDPFPGTPEAVAVLRRRLLDDSFLRGTVISDDGRATALIGRLESWAADPNERIRYFRDVQAILDEEEGTAFHIAGSPYLEQAVMGHIFADGRFYVPVVLAIYLVALWRVFGRVRAGWVPILPMVMASTITMGAIVGSGMPLSMLTGSGTLPILIMIIGFSDAIHLLSQWEEEVTRRPSGDRTVPIREAVRHIGVACLLTSATTAVGLSSLGVSRVSAVRDFGIFAAFGVMIVYASVILLIPALLVLVERRWPASPRPPSHEDALDRLLARIARVTLSRPRTIIALGLGLLVASSAAIPWVRIDNRFTTDLREDDPVMRSLRFVERHFGGVLPFEILVKGGGPDAVKEPRLLEAADRLREAFLADPAVSTVLSPTEFLKRLNRAMHGGDPAAYRIPDSKNLVAQYLLLFEMAGGDSEFDRLVSSDHSVLRIATRTKDVPPEEIDRLRERLRELAAGLFDGRVTVQESGYGPLFSTATRTVLTTLLQSLYLAMPVIFLVIALSFRSLRIGLLSALPNVIPLTFALGFLGVAGIPLRFATIIAFPLAFGIAVDDTIHFLARYRTEIRAGATPEEAVRATYRTTGRAMVLTTAFFVGGYGIMMGSSFLATSQIAMLAALILTVALLGDLFLLPALLLVFRPGIGER